MDTIALEARFEHAVKRSRFVAIALSVYEEDAFRSRLDAIRADVPGADHYVFAYFIRDRAGRFLVRFSDDGEPHNSAGKPVLAPIQGRGLVNTAVVVARYFGGVKLGVGGLVRAYGGSSGAVLDLAGRTPVVRVVQCVEQVGYAGLQEAERRLAKAGGRITRKEFGERITIHYEKEKDDNAPGS